MTSPNIFALRALGRPTPMPPMRQFQGSTGGPMPPQMMPPGMPPNLPPQGIPPMALGADRAPIAAEGPGMVGMLPPQPMPPQQLPPAMQRPMMNPQQQFMRQRMGLM